jgi:hypothetical protein
MPVAHARHRFAYSPQGLHRCSSFISARLHFANGEGPYGRADAPPKASEKSANDHVMGYVSPASIAFTSFRAVTMWLHPRRGVRERRVATYTARKCVVTLWLMRHSSVPQVTVGVIAVPGTLTRQTKRTNCTCRCNAFSSSTKHPHGQCRAAREVQNISLERHADGSERCVRRSITCVRALRSLGGGSEHGNLRRRGVPVPLSSSRLLLLRTANRATRRLNATMGPPR